MNTSNPYHLYIYFDDLSGLWTPQTKYVNELLIKCAFQSIEFICRMIGDIQNDWRVTARKQERIKRLLRNIEGQLQLVSEVIDISAEKELENILTTRETGYSNIDYLFSLDEDHTYSIKKLVDAFFQLSERLPHGIGIETRIEGLQSKFKLPKSIFTRESFLPYEKWIQPEIINQMRDEQPFGPEDFFFLTIHQATECWLFLIFRFLSLAYKDGNESKWPSATFHLNCASRMFEHLEKQIQILEMMVLADYHPLRVSLKGSSGAQSKGAANVIKIAKNIIGPILKHLERKKLRLLDIYQNPNLYLEYYQHLEAISNLGTRISGFFFVHYQLALIVQGNDGLGALGRGIRILTKKFTEPFYEDLNSLRYDHNMHTNYEHAESAGFLIYQKEDRDSKLPRSMNESVLFSEEVLKDVIKNYINSLQSLDVDSLLCLIDDKGIIEDPPGSRPYIGHSELKGYFQNIAQTFNTLSFHVHHLQFERCEVALTWSGEGQIYNGKNIDFQGVSQFVVNEKRKIQSIKVNWNPKIVASHI